MLHQIDICHTGKRIIGHLRNTSLSSGFNAWYTAYHEMTRISAMYNKVVMRLSSTSLTSAFLTWCELSRLTRKCRAAAEFSIEKFSQGEHISPLGPWRQWHDSTAKNVSQKALLHCYVEYMAKFNLTKERILPARAS